VRIIGQDNALNTLRSALGSGRMHHAWIFAGPRGVGKFTTALHLARALLEPTTDPRSLGAESQPDTETGALIKAGRHPDLHIIRKELALYSDSASVRSRKQLNIPVDVLREHMIGGMVGEKQHEAAAYRTSALGHGKVFIIDEAELLAREAQNTLLKTLEEPPPRTYILLVTAHPERLFTTIHSRCHQVRFQNLDDSSMQKWAEQALADVPKARRAWILRFAHGSPGLALQSVEFGYDQWHNDLEPMFGQLADGLYPPTMGAAMGNMVDGFATDWVQRHTNASKEAANQYGFGIMMAVLGLQIRHDLQRAAHTGDAATAERCSVVIDLLREAESQLHANVNVKLVLENLVAQWSSAMRGEIVFASV
jgi:DNA polymerase-3 subunit delta'